MGTKYDAFLHRWEALPGLIEGGVHYRQSRKSSEQDKSISGGSSVPHTESTVEFCCYQMESLSLQNASKNLQTYFFS